MQKRLFRPKDVERFTIFPNKVIYSRTPSVKPHREILLGKIKFKGGKTKRVAVKPFKSGAGMSPEEFNQMILRLRKAGLPVPKATVLEHQGAPYQIMELFSRQGKSKLLGNVESYEHLFSMTLKDKPIIEKLARDYAKIFNCGYATDFIDVESYLKRKKGREKHYFIDFHLVSKIDKKRENLQPKMEFLYEWGGFLEIKDPQARALFINTFRQTLKPLLRKEWDKAVKAAEERRP